MLSSCKKFGEFWEETAQPAIKEGIYHEYCSEYASYKIISTVNKNIPPGLDLPVEVELGLGVYTLIDLTGEPITPEQFYKDMNNIPWRDAPNK